MEIRPEATMPAVPSVPKPRPPVKVEGEKKIERPKVPFVPKPHLTHKPFQNRGLNDFKLKLKKR